MKIFLSWSGERSNAVATYMRTWLQCVIQASQPWLSSKDMDRGTIWFSEISDQLKDTLVGIVFLTKENRNRPWILFEAGALAKGLSTSRVCPFLIDLDTTDIEPPLSQFNLTVFSRESVYQLVNAINNAGPEQLLSQPVLDMSFNTYWPQLESAFNTILTQTHSSAAIVPKRDESEILSEILENSRSTMKALNNRLSRVENVIANEVQKSSNKHASYAPANNAFENLMPTLKAPQIFPEVGGGFAESLARAQIELERSSALLRLGELTDTGKALKSFENSSALEALAKLDANSADKALEKLKQVTTFGNLEGALKKAGVPKPETKNIQAKPNKLDQPSQSPQSKAK